MCTPTMSCHNVPMSFCIPPIKPTLGKSIIENSGAEMGFVAGLEPQRCPGGDFVFNLSGCWKSSGSAPRLPVGS